MRSALIGCESNRRNRNTSDRLFLFLVFKCGCAAAVLQFPTIPAALFLSLHLNSLTLFLSFPPIKLDLGHRITEKFNQPVATKMVQKQNPLLTIFKIGKWKSLGEDFSIRPLVQKLVHNYSLARIKPYTKFAHNKDALRCYYSADVIISAALLSQGKFKCKIL